MSFAPARTSDLIRLPIPRHVAILERHGEYVGDHIDYCDRKVGSCLVMFCVCDRYMSRGYLPLPHCSVITLMTYGLEEHEAIEVKKAVERCDLRTRAAVLIADGDFKSGTFSFVEVEV